MPASISSRCRSDIALHGGWDTHSSALGLQTQQGQMGAGGRGWREEELVVGNGQVIDHN
jgi:hypothetical protein